MTSDASQWLFAEDKALKQWLSDMTVSDSKDPNRPVGTWFGQPDIEVQRQAFPFLTIDLVDVREATERTHRGYIHLAYQPDGQPAEMNGYGYNTDYPIPYDLTYQVTTYARQPQHDRQIIYQIMHYKLGGRMHSLYIPNDNTERSMFLIGSQKRDSTDGDGRRLFSNAYTVQVFTELLPCDIDQIKQVEKVEQTVLTIKQVD